MNGRAVEQRAAGMGIGLVYLSPLHVPLMLEVPWPPPDQVEVGGGRPTGLARGDGTPIVERVVVRCPLGAKVEALMLACYLAPPADVSPPSP